MRVKLLVIGYGNDLRSDDGVGPKVATATAELNLPGVRAVACQQLTPELAQPISTAERVLFIDAAVNSSGAIELRRIEPVATTQVMTHAADPRLLLGLTKAILGHCPPALWLTIPVANLAFGEALSPLARQGVEAAMARIRSLIE